MTIGSIGRALLVTGVALGVMPVLGANPAYACSCIQTDEQYKYDEATHVFKGALTEGAPELTGDQEHGAGSVTYTFDVISSYKGAVADPQKVSTASASATCGVNLEGAGPFLVFAHDDTEPTGGAASIGDDPPATEQAPTLTMNLCGGTRPIGLNDEPTFGETPDGTAPDGTAPEGTTPAEPATPTVEPPKAAEPPTETAPAENPAEEEGKSAVGTAVSKVSGYLEELAGPIKPPAE